MGTTKVTPPEGLHPDSLPPDFDGWDQEPNVPTHPLGTVTAIDHDSGLPIVKRNSSDTAKPEEAPEEPEPKPEALAKGTPVTVNGKPGKVVFLHQEMGIARVKTDDGRKLTVRLGALKIMPHIQVAAHIRKVPAK